MCDQVLHGSLEEIGSEIGSFGESLLNGWEELDLEESRELNNIEDAMNIMKLPG